MQFFYRLISIIFHPLLILSYALMFLLLINPYVFSVQDYKAKALILFSIIMLSVVFPALSIFMMRGLGLIKSLEMKDKKERIVPLIITGIFYLWLFVNIKNNTLVPLAFKIFVLGATVSLFLAFFINNFSKISLHTVGMGGLFAIVFIIRYNFSYESFIIDSRSLGIYEIHFNFIVLIIIVISGLVGTARLALKAHNIKDVYAGYMVGLVGQILSYRLLFEY